MSAAELIEDALTQLKWFSPDVQKAALLRIARVQTVTSPAEARETLEKGLAMPPGMDAHKGFAHLSRVMIAAVHPELLATVPPPAHQGAGFSHLGHELARVMKDHGHLSYLRKYVLQGAPLSEVPMSGIQSSIRDTGDPEEQGLLLRRALAVWRVNRERPHNREHLAVYVMFRDYGKVLPHAEAQAAVSEIVDALLARADSPVSGTVGQLVFTSSRSLELFQMWHLLELESERADKVLAANPELAKSLTRYPKGMESLQEEVRAKQAKLPPPDAKKRGYIMAGSSQADFDYGHALLNAEETTDFSEPLKYAEASYREDSDEKFPNRALKEFWPSGAKYKSVFRRMGRILGDSAEQHLDEIPDSDLRLLAQIELAAGLCGLPELGSMTQSMRPRRPSML